MKPLVVLGRQSAIAPDGRFHTWASTPDDRLWTAMRQERAVPVIMQAGGRWYTGAGVPDLISGTGVRLAGRGARRLGRLTGWIVRHAARQMAAR